MSLADYEHEFCGHCGEHMPGYVRGVYYCGPECREAAEGPLDPDPDRDTIACVLSVEIAEEGRDTLVDLECRPDAGALEVGGA